GYGESQWDYSPYAVAVTFNHFYQKATVGDAPLNDIQSAGRTIARGICQQHQPLIALIDDAKTWVLIVGVTLGPSGLAGPPAGVVLDDPWPIDQWGPSRNGHTAAALGVNTRLTWGQFAAHFTRVPSSLPGIWSDRWVLIAPGLALVS